MSKLSCWLLGHKSHIKDVQIEWGFPRAVPCFCRRCGKEGTWFFIGGKYRLTWRRLP